MIITTAEGDEYQALYYLKQFGLRVPEDISLAGFIRIFRVTAIRR